MTSESFGNVPHAVHELAERLTREFEKSLAEPTIEKHQKEFDRLRATIETHGFTVAIVAIKDVRGEIEKLKLAIYRIDGVPMLH